MFAVPLIGKASGSEGLFQANGRVAWTNHHQGNLAGHVVVEWRVDLLAFFASSWSYQPCKGPCLLRIQSSLFIFLTRLARAGRISAS